MTHLLPIALLSALLLPLTIKADEPAKNPVAPLVAGQLAPDFKIKDSKGHEIVLSELTAKGPPPTAKGVAPGGRPGGPPSP